MEGCVFMLCYDFDICLKAEENHEKVVRIAWVQSRIWTRDL